MKLQQKDEAYISANIFAISSLFSLLSDLSSASIFCGWSKADSKYDITLIFGMIYLFPNLSVFISPDYKSR